MFTLYRREPRNRQDHVSCYVLPFVCEQKYQITFRGISQKLRACLFLSKSSQNELFELSCILTQTEVVGDNNKNNKSLNTLAIRRVERQIPLSLWRYAKPKQSSSRDEGSISSMWSNISHNIVFKWISATSSCQMDGNGIMAVS